MKSKRNPNIRNLLIIGSLLAFSGSALALSNDTKQPIQVDSLTQSLDMQNNTVTFLDNVVVTQGSINIKANKVVVTRPNGDQSKTIIDAYGSPATFYQMQDNGKPVTGHAQKITYEVAKEFVTLSGNAFLQQQDSSVNADRITYLVPKQQMDAYSDKGKHVTTILVPSQLQQDKNQKKTSEKKSQ